MITMDFMLAMLSVLLIEVSQLGDVYYIGVLLRGVPMLYDILIIKSISPNSKINHIDCENHSLHIINITLC